MSQSVFSDPNQPKDDDGPTSGSGVEEEGKARLTLAEKKHNHIASGKSPTNQPNMGDGNQDSNKTHDMHRAETPSSDSRCL
jgi:hypothetical protein